MDIDRFWDLVEEARRSVDDPDDAQDIASRATALLAACDPREILDAQQIIWDLMATAYRAPPWAAAYLINGGCSDDGFDYFRGWVTTRGRATFEQVVADADRPADLSAVRRAVVEGVDLECEEMPGIVWHAHRQATGDDLPADRFTLSHPPLDPDWNFAFEDTARVAARLPRLAALCLD
ncbi:DUF4240 domain-containing protein [Peterkaempfera griseoplana]|uniref:DUF4240 domain-containing protein n=1 Tax=Peterkaempfera griseoplana TaxID=66896 RepID=UPI0006E1D74C|nr:DUF4240 domain-containing protein [Peterkaempfera griseoplana]